MEWHTVWSFYSRNHRNPYTYISFDSKDLCPKYMIKDIRY